MSEMAGKILLQVDNLVKLFPVKRSSLFKKQVQYVHAVDGISLDVIAEQTIAIVGESGSGKTTLARLMLNLLEPTRGKIIWQGRDITQLSSRELFQFRREAQIIFQNPEGALNPRKTIRKIFYEPLKLHFKSSGVELENKVNELMLNVGLNPSLHLDRYPHEFSGGQRQRICIARALSLNPKIIFCDEPVSALDVSIQAQVLNLLKKLKETHKLTYIFITHDLALTRSFASHVHVMYLGEIIESGPVDEIFSEPYHPYTRLLLASTPIPNPKKARKRQPILSKGEIPSPIDPPPGCRFHTRCPHAMAKCKNTRPTLFKNEKRLVYCHLLK